MSGFYSNHARLSLKFNLSEPVIEDFVKSHITTGGGSISSSLTSISDTEYEADFTSSGHGLKTIVVDAGKIIDRAENSNTDASNMFEWKYDCDDGYHFAEYIEKSCFTLGGTCTNYPGFGCQGGRNDVQLSDVDLATCQDACTARSTCLSIDFYVDRTGITCSLSDSATCSFTSISDCRYYTITREVPPPVHDAELYSEMMNSCASKCSAQSDCRAFEIQNEGLCVLRSVAEATGCSTDLYVLYDMRMPIVSLHTRLTFSFLQHIRLITLSNIFD